MADLLTVRILALAGCFWLTTSSGHSQIRVPPKDVAILVDVSKSVSPDSKKYNKDKEVTDKEAHDLIVKLHTEARAIIKNLVTGTPIDWSQSAWVPEATNNSDLRKLFGQSLGLSGEAPPQPLISDGHNLLILPFGKLSTVLPAKARRRR